MTCSSTCPRVARSRSRPRRRGGSRPRSTWLRKLSLSPAASVTSATYNDTAADDTFAAVNGTLTTLDRDAGDTAAYSVSGGASDNSLAGFDTSVAGDFGTLYLNSSSGAYRYVANDSAIEGLKTTDHVDFTVSVTDGSGASDSDTLTITLNGVNDTPEASATK